MDGPLVLIGAGASLAAGLLTAAGALPVFFVRRISESIQDAMLGFAAGVMMAASVFSLILPDLEEAQIDLANETAATLVVIAGILIGGAVLWLINERVPHEHFILGYEGPPTERLRRIWLFVIAITLHNDWRSASGSAPAISARQQPWRWESGSRISRKAWPWRWPC